MPLRSGDVIDGKYRLERTLGIGGMGIVFEAQHIELEVRRAIKIMQPATGRNTAADDLDPNARVRFLREARAAARIVSEHVAHVYDVGVLESGERYMVIEYLSGTDLERLVRKRGPLSADMAMGYLLQACSGIAEAHKLGIIHRDIKSSNLFLTENGMIKVIDWGLAKQTLNGETGITQANHVVGSLAYMSPEQLDGGEVDARTDIWSLGVVLHELITGKLPFSGDTYGEIIHNILHKEPTATTWMSEISLALDAIMRRCLQKDRSLRYASVDALARDLRAVVIPQPSMRDTIELSSGGMPSQASLSDTSTAERRSSKHEQETAALRHRREQLTDSSRPKARESKPSTGSRTAERDRRTSRSRATLYTLSVMALFVLLVYVVSVPTRPSSPPVTTAATSGPSHTGGNDEVSRKREPETHSELPKSHPPSPEPQSSVAAPPPAPAAPAPAAPRGEVAAARAAHTTTRDRPAHPAPPSIAKPAPEASSAQISAPPLTHHEESPGSERSAPLPPSRRDMSAHHGHPASDSIYKQ